VLGSGEVVLAVIDLCGAADVLAVVRLAPELHTDVGLATANSGEEEGVRQLGSMGLPVPDGPGEALGDAGLERQRCGGGGRAACMLRLLLLLNCRVQQKTG
jgi:hypothetical protein